MATETTRLDLSDAQTAGAAARTLYEYLRDEHAGEHVDYYRPDDNPRQNGAYAVVWEGGPHEWAVWLTGGESLYTGQSTPIEYDGDPEVTGLYGHDWLAEPHYSFDIQFHPGT